MIIGTYTMTLSSARDTLSLEAGAGGECILMPLRRAQRPCLVSPCVLGHLADFMTGALVTMAFFFAYTQVKSNAQNFGFSCAIGFCLVSACLFPISLCTWLHSHAGNSRQHLSREGGVLVRHQVRYER